MKIYTLIVVGIVFAYSLILFLFPVIDRNIYEEKKKVMMYYKKCELDKAYYIFTRIGTIILLITSLLYLVIFLILM